jgi:hypothetical protein
VGLAARARAAGVLLVIGVGCMRASAVVLQAPYGPQRAAPIAALQPPVHRAKMRVQRALCRQTTQARQRSEMQARNLMHPRVTCPCPTGTDISGLDFTRYDAAEAQGGGGQKLPEAPHAREPERQED